MIMNTIIKDIKNLVNNSIIKIDSIAKQYETLESITDSDRYISAVQKTDRFDLYSTFDIDAVGDAFRNENGEITISEELQFQYANNPYVIPIQYRDKVLNKQREYIINEYIEINNYYRMLNGRPNIESDESEFITLTEDQLNRSNIVNHGYIHNFSNDEIYKVEESGVLDEIIAQYPQYRYLRHLGKNKVDIVTARITNNFGILKINNESIPDYFYNKFLQIYEECRQYFMTVLYIQSYSNSYKLYDNFIGLCIMFMTIQRLVSNIFKFGIEREFYDWSFIQNLYKTYNVPFVDTLPIEYHIIIIKNLNNLLRYKSTDKVLFDIASLLGYERIKIFKYFLVKKHKLNQNEEPLFFYKQKIDIEGNPVFNSDGTPVLVEDLERMYDIYFQKVDLNTDNLPAALQDTENGIDYDETILDDPYWYEDANLTEMKYNEVYNYVETKYMSLNLMYKMTDMLFELTYAFRMMIDKKDELDNIMVSLPKIYLDTDFKLFDVVIFMIALMCKLNGFKDGLITTPSKISHLYGFNFNTDSINRIKSIILDNKKIVDQDLLEYFNNLTINEADDVNNLFIKIRDYNNLIIDKMRNSNNIDEYRLYKKIFNISMASETQTHMFKIKKYDNNGNVIGETIAKTYTEYLEYASPILAEIVKNTNTSEISSMMNHLISILNDIVESMEYLSIINDNNNPVFNALVSLIKFFKSYTVDIHGLNIIYLFDSKYYNMLKFVEDIHMIKVNMDIDGTLNQLYTDDMCKIGVQLGNYKDKYDLKDICRSYLSISVFDKNKEFFMKDMINDMDKYIEYKGTLDHQYSGEVLMNNSTVFQKDTYRMRDDILLYWET